MSTDLAVEAPVVSVVIPAFNAERDLPLCLDALSQQEGAPPFEVLVVDDGSNDRTAALADSRGARVFRQENRGPGEARNRGAAEARGDILVFTDADCEPDRAFLHEIAAAFDDPAVDGALGAYRTRQRSWVARHLQIEFTYNYRKLHRHRTIDHVPTHAAAYRLSAFREGGGFRPQYRGASQEDVDLSYRLAAMGKRLVFRQSAIVYHRHPDTFRGYLRQKYTRAKWKVLLYSEHPGKAATDTYTSQILKAQLVLLMGGVGATAAGTLGELTGHHSTAPWLTVLLFGATFLISTAPQAMHAARADSLKLGLVSPCFALARAAAFLLGLVSGLALIVRGSKPGSRGTRPRPSTGP